MGFIMLNKKLVVIVDFFAILILFTYFFQFLNIYVALNFLQLLNELLFTIGLEHGILE